MDDGKSNPKPILVKFQRWKDKTKIFYKRKILPANFQIREDLTPKQIHDNAKLEAYAKLVCPFGRKMSREASDLVTYVVYI